MNHDPDQYDSGSIDESVVRRLQEAHEEIMESGIVSAEHLSAHAEDSVASVEKLKPAVNAIELIERVRRKAVQAGAETLDGGSTEVDHSQPLNVPPGMENLPSDDQDQPSQLGHFEIVRQIGQGGYGLVFQAYDSNLDRMVALKVPRPEVVLTPNHQERFVREAKAAALLSHPNIVPVFEAGRAGSVWFIASEFVDGATLAQWLKQFSMTHDEAAEFVAKLADAVQHAHARGVLHRDLKPGNILLDNPSTKSASLEKDRLNPRITDFGLAKIIDDASANTQTGSVVGTPSYMSPEQTRSEEATAASDVYSLGTILYELLTGNVPFKASGILETIKAVQEKEPTPLRQASPELTPDLEAVCLKCLEKNPADRYQTAFQLHEDLQNVLQRRPVTARHYSTWDRLKKWMVRNPALATSTTIAAAAILIGLISVTALWLRSDHLRRAADASSEKATDKAEQLTEAVQQLMAVIDETPEIQLAGMEGLRSKLLNQYNTIYDQFLQEKPDEPTLEAKYADILFRLTSARAKLGDRRGAITSSEQLLEQLPEFADSDTEQKNMRIRAMVLQAAQQAVLGENEQPATLISTARSYANTVYEESPEGDRERVELAITLGQLAQTLSTMGYKTESNDTALQAVQLWQQVDPEYIENHDHLVDMGRALVIATKSLTSGRTDEARPLCLQAIELFEQLYAESDPPAPMVLLSLGEAHRLMGFMHDRDFENSQKSFARSWEVYLQLVDKHPLVPLYHQRLLSVRYSHALSKYIHARGLSGDEADQMFTASADQLKENIVAANDLLNQFPDNQLVTTRSLSNSYALLGIVQGWLEDYEGKMATLLECRRLNQQLYDESGGRPDHAVALAGVDGDIATCLWQMKRFEESIQKAGENIQRLQAIVDSDPDYGEARRFLSSNHETKADAHEQLEQWDLAILHYEKTKEFYFYDDNRIFDRYLARCLMRQGNLDHARATFETYITYEYESESSRARKPANIARWSSILLDAMQQTDLSGIPENEVTEVENDIAEKGVDALQRIANDDETSTSLEELLENDQLAALKATELFQDWDANRSR